MPDGEIVAHIQTLDDCVASTILRVELDVIAPLNLPKRPHIPIIHRIHSAPNYLLFSGHPDPLASLDLRPRPTALAYALFA